MLIFTASTGRCGTLFASEVFRTLTAVPSYHEPQPWCVDQTLEDINNKNILSRYSQIELDDKIQQIRDSVYKGWYFESSQMFIKSYYMQVLENFDNIGCLYIERNPTDVLKSYAKKCRHRDGGWFLRSNWRANELRMSEELPFYDNVLWQWLEVKERYIKIKRYFNKTYELDFRNINNPDEWRRIFKAFSVPHREFKNLPKNLRKNQSNISDEVIMKKIINDKNKPIADIKTKDREHIRRERLIEDAKIMLANNSAEVNRCRI